MSRQDLWELQVNEPHLKMWISKSGSFINSEIPLIHTEFFFRERYPFDLIVNSVIDVSQKVKWDENISSLKVIRKFATNGIMYHTVYKSASKIIPEKDFVEKRVYFRLQNVEQREVVISFASSVPNYHCPASKNRIRCSNIVH